MQIDVGPEFLGSQYKLAILLSAQIPLRRFAPHVHEFLSDFRNPRVFTKIVPIDPQFSFHILISLCFKCHFPKIYNILVICS